MQVYLYDTYIYSNLKKYKSTIQGDSEGVEHAETKDSMHNTCISTKMHEEHFYFYTFVSDIFGMGWYNVSVKPFVSNMLTLVLSRKISPVA